MKTVKLALVGINGYGKTYLDYLLDRNDPRIRVVGLVEPYLQGCSRLAELQKRSIPIYPDCHTLYKNETVDLTVIASPIPFHTEQILCALQNGSHVLCEKPLCADERDIPLLLEAERQSGRLVFIGYQWSFSCAIGALKQDILAGKLGKCHTMTSMVLWPRTTSYFGRGTGWAGKIRLPDGTAVYDSVANNAAAHYLHNMLFLLGDFGKAAEPKVVECQLYRANSIENFDTAKITVTVEGGTVATFLAAHPVRRNLEPTFTFQFDRATVCYSAVQTKNTLSLMPPEYTEYGKIVAIHQDGSNTVYGNPFAGSYNKLEAAVEAALTGEIVTVPCGIEAAAMHTRLINRIQNGFEIRSFDPIQIRRENELVYVEGLYERFLELYRDPTKAIQE